MQSGEARVTTPFDDVVQRIRERGFHNHRLEDHSEAMSRGILNDLRAYPKTAQGVND